jgi:hypothetical protein
LPAITVRLQSAGRNRWTDIRCAVHRLLPISGVSGRGSQAIDDDKDIAVS